MATQMRRRRFAGVAGWVAAVVAVPALVMLLAAGSLRGQGQPIYEHGAYDPVGFGTSGARVQLLRVALHEGAQVWVYEVTSGGRPPPSISGSSASVPTSSRPTSLRRPRTST